MRISNFIYWDDFEVASGARVIDNEGGRMIKKINPNGRFHSGWRTEAYSQPMLARKLLTADGAAFTSIAENAVSALKLRM